MSANTTITGKLTRDPDIRYTREGRAMTNLQVGSINEDDASKSFFDVVCWGELAENVALSLCKGHHVVVTGELAQRAWETDEGDLRFKVELVASDVAASLRLATADVMKVERSAVR